MTTTTTKKIWKDYEDDDDDCNRILYVEKIEYARKLWQNEKNKSKQLFFWKKNINRFFSHSRKEKVLKHIKRISSGPCCLYRAAWMPNQDWYHTHTTNPVCLVCRNETKKRQEQAKLVPNIITTFNVCFLMHALRQQPNQPTKKPNEQNETKRNKPKKLEEEWWPIIIIIMAAQASD